MKREFYTGLVVAGLLVLNACSGGQDSNTNANIDSVQVAVDSVPVLYTVNCASIAIRTGPGKKYPKLINQKASDALHEKQYCTVDQSVKVEILDEKSVWTKIRVVQPDWLRDTHIGWIPSEVLISAQDMDKKTTVELDPKEYQIMVTDHRPVVQNFHVWLKHRRFDKDYIYAFTKAFRKKHCTMQCNVAIYDSESIKNLVLVYPLKDKDYLRLADHLISISTFDATDVKDWYPYQDFHYRDLGGKNWKKEPVN